MSKSNEIRVLFVRTGQTEWDMAGRIGGSVDVPLSRLGHEQVGQAAAELGDTQLSTVYTGPDEASLATAHEIAKLTGAKFKVAPDLSEMNLGLWQGLLVTQLQEKCPSCVRALREDACSVQAPEGESLEEASERLMGALARTVGKARADSGAVGVVLRPIASALVGCAIKGLPTRNLLSMMDSGLTMEWRTVQRSMIAPVRERARAGT